MFQGDRSISPSSNHSEATGRGGSVPVRGVCEVRVYPAASRERKNNNFPSSSPFFCYCSSGGLWEPTTCKYITLKGVFKVIVKLFHVYSARRSFLITDHFTNHSSRVYRMSKSRFIFPQENNLQKGRSIQRSNKAIIIIV